MKKNLESTFRWIEFFTNSPQNKNANIQDHSMQARKSAGKISTLDLNANIVNFVPTMPFKINSSNKIGIPGK